jgi:AcrR family transcriptional regulator
VSGGRGGRIGNPLDREPLAGPPGAAFHRRRWRPQAIRFVAPAHSGRRRQTFSRDRHTKTSLRDIGKRAGMKAGSLYYHFASKEELVAEVLRTGVKRVHRAVVSAIYALDPDADAKTRLGAAMTAHLETLLDASNYTSAHIRCFPNMPENLGAQLGADRREYKAIWRALWTKPRRAASCRREWIREWRACSYSAR